MDFNVLELIVMMLPGMVITLNFLQHSHNVLPES